MEKVGSSARRHAWDCMDDRRQPVSMIGDELRWAELDNAKQASVSKIEYYGFWSALIH